MSSGPATLMPYTVYKWEPKRSTLLTLRNCYYQAGGHWNNLIHVLYLFIRMPSVFFCLIIYTERLIFIHCTWALIMTTEPCVTGTIAFIQRMYLWKNILWLFFKFYAYLYASLHRLLIWWLLAWCCMNSFTSRIKLYRTNLVEMCVFYVHAYEYNKAFKRLSNQLFPSKCEYDHGYMFFHAAAVPFCTYWKIDIKLQSGNGLLLSYDIM